VTVFFFFGSNARWPAPKGPGVRFRPAVGPVWFLGAGKQGGRRFVGDAGPTLLRWSEVEGVRGANRKVPAGPGCKSLPPAPPPCWGSRGRSPTNLDFPASTGINRVFIFWKNWEACSRLPPPPPRVGTGPILDGISACVGVCSHAPQTMVPPVVRGGRGGWGVCPGGGGGGGGGGSFSLPGTGGLSPVPSVQTGVLGQVRPPPWFGALVWPVRAQRAAPTRTRAREGPRGMPAAGPEREGVSALLANCGNAGAFEFGPAVWNRADTRQFLRSACSKKKAGGTRGKGSGARFHRRGPRRADL